MDYKAPLEGYPSLCGANSAGVPESLALLRGSGVPYELRKMCIRDRKRLVHSKPLSVWIHFMVKPLCLKKAYAFFKKSTEE